MTLVQYFDIILVVFWCEFMTSFSTKCCDIILAHKSQTINFSPEILDISA